ncbi:MAG: alpha/beta fold hydrolase [Deltaproteobacteria bacterium]|nr:alpha/beta fold hydrolase [Deltaproteobacteria bacterium]
MSQNTLHFYSVGSGWPAVLMVHGAGGSHGTLRELARLISAGRRVVAIDLPAHGHSAKTVDLADSRRLFSAYVDQLAEFGEAQGLGRFVFVGHSMGGALGQLFAERYGDRLAGLVLISSAARFVLSAELRSALSDGDLPMLRELIARTAYSVAHLPATIDRWLAAQLQAPIEAIRADYLACQHFDGRETLAKIDCPTDLIYGTDDRITPADGAAALASAIADCRVHLIERAGHQVVQERADAAAQLLNALIDRRYRR